MEVKEKEFDQILTQFKGVSTALNEVKDGLKNEVQTFSEQLLLYKNELKNEINQNQNEQKIDEQNSEEEEKYGEILTKFEALSTSKNLEELKNEIKNQLSAEFVYFTTELNKTNQNQNETLEK